MKTEQITQQELFRALRKYVCNNDKVAYIMGLTWEGQKEMMLRYVDSLLSVEYDERLYYITDNLINTDEDSDAPVRYDFEDDMDERHMKLLRFYRCVVQMAYDLSKEKLDVLEFLGIGKGENISFNSRKLNRFIKETPYRSLAYHIARGCSRKGIEQCISTGNQPAQDYLAETRGTPSATKRTDKETARIVDALKRYEKHLKEGAKMGLTLEEIIVHDEIFGYFMERFEPKVVPVAKRIAAFIIEEMSKHVKGYDVEENMCYQSPKVIQRIEEGARRVAEYVMGLRDKELLKGYPENYILTYEYFISHAERMAVVLANERK